VGPVELRNDEVANGPLGTDLGLYRYQEFEVELTHSVTQRVSLFAKPFAMNEKGLSCVHTIVAWALVGLGQYDTFSILRMEKGFETNLARPTLEQD
jgi:hypothetical protein